MHIRSLITCVLLIVALAAMGACVAEGCPGRYRPVGGRCARVADAALDAGDGAVSADLDASVAVDGGCERCPVLRPICVASTLECVECTRDTDCLPARPLCSALQECVPQ